MTRTARSGSKTKALQATPWARLKAGYQTLKDSSDVSDSGPPASADSSEDVDPTLRICTKPKLKEKKKEKLLTKTRKLSKKHLKDIEKMPLLTETSISENNSDDGDTLPQTVSEKPRAKNPEHLTPEELDVSAEVQSMPVAKQKRKRKRSKITDDSEDKLPLITGGDSDGKAKCKKKRKKNETAIQPRAAHTSHSTFDDERRQKRNEARRIRRQRRKVCFNCRESGHHVSECTKETTGTGICFKCGSNDHISKKCKMRVPEGEYPYAKCFVCGETGHLSKVCPENPKGLYPQGGGCNLCGSVEHFKANCPSRHQNPARRHTKGAGQLTSGHGSVDAEDFDHEPVLADSKSKRKHVKPGPKVVHF